MSWPDPVSTVRGVTLDDYRAGLGEYLGAVASDAWANGPLSQAVRGIQGSIAQAEAEDRGDRLLTADEASDQGRELGLRFDAPIAQGAFDVLANEKRRQAAAEGTFKRARQEGGYGTLSWLLGGGTEFLVQAADPLNLASAFIPVVGEARYAAMAARIGRFPAALAKGAAEGAVGQAALEPINVLDRRQLGEDTGLNTVLSDLAFGGALGAVLHGAGYGAGAGFRFIRDRYVMPERAAPVTAARVTAPPEERPAPPREEAPVPAPESAAPAVVKEEGPPPRQPVAEAMETLRPETKDTALKTAIAQLAQDKPVDVEPVLRADPRWPAVQAEIEKGHAEASALQRQSAASQPLPTLDPPAGWRPASDELRQAQRMARGWTPEKPEAAPLSLSEFVDRRGGVKAAETESSNLLAQDLKRLVRESGVSHDELARLAHKAGYRVAAQGTGDTGVGNGVDAAAFLNALIDDASGVRKVLPEDAHTEAWRAQQAFFDNWSAYIKSDLGLEPRGMDPRQLAWLLSRDPDTARLLSLVSRIDRLGEGDSLELAHRLDAERAALEAEIAAREPGAFEPGPLRRIDVASESAARIDVVGGRARLGRRPFGIVEFRVNGDKAHGIEGRIGDGAFTVTASSLPETLRGQGHGLALYERAINWAEQHGLAFHSDSSVSPAAQRVYDALAQHGYDVERQPGTVPLEQRLGRAEGTIGREDGPVFIVKSSEPRDRAAPTLDELERYYAEFDRAAGPREPGPETAGRQPAAGRAGEGGEAGAAGPAGRDAAAADAGLRRAGEPGAEGAEGTTADLSRPQPAELAEFAQRQAQADLHADPAALEERDARLAGEERDAQQLLADDLKQYGHLLDDQAKAELGQVAAEHDATARAAEALAACIGGRP